jgi:hypothetical protein
MTPLPSVSAALKNWAYAVDSSGVRLREKVSIVGRDIIMIKLRMDSGQTTLPERVGCGMNGEFLSYAAAACHIPRKCVKFRNIYWEGICHLSGDQLK